MAIFLCGFMGCGKTTIGKNLAKLLGCGYCDMDELIVKKAGMSTVSYTHLTLPTT